MDSPMEYLKENQTTVDVAPSTAPGSRDEAAAAHQEKKISRSAWSNWFHAFKQILPIYLRCLSLGISQPKPYESLHCGLHGFVGIAVILRSLPTMVTMPPGEQPSFRFSLCLKEESRFLLMILS